MQNEFQRGDLQLDLSEINELSNYHIMITCSHCEKKNAMRDFSPSAARQYLMVTAR